MVGSNFAPGTTAADIQSAIEPIVGQTLSCLVTSSLPTVSAEIVFAERWAAETTIANFHNQKVPRPHFFCFIEAANMNQGGRPDPFNATKTGGHS